MKDNSPQLYQRPSAGEEQVIEMIPVLDLSFQMNNISWGFERRRRKKRQGWTEIPMGASTCSTEKARK